MTDKSTDTRTMPVVFSGHGSPMLALENNQITKTLRRVGDEIRRTYGTPKAILSISGHWFAGGTFIQSAPEPKQVYDMYGFPEELYQVKYPVKGNRELTDRVLELLGDQVSVNDTWGIDHGTWTVLCHMFPEADIPVVQLSVNRNASPEECYKIEESLQTLREEGFLIFGSGNIVHNLRRVEWDNPNGSAACVAFNDAIVERVLARKDEEVVHFEGLPHATYAVPTPGHYLPLLYCLGAAKDLTPTVFNNVCNLGAIAMTGFVFE